jgi:pyruvate/2-oxoacid:ferredoxin oxidoreductase beta subunit
MRKTNKSNIRKIKYIKEMKRFRVIAFRNYEGEKHEEFKNARKDAGAIAKPKWLEDNNVSNNRKEFENLFDDKPPITETIDKRFNKGWAIYKNKIKSKMSKEEWQNNKTAIYNEWLMRKKAA